MIKSIVKTNNVIVPWWYQWNHDRLHVYRSHWRERERNLPHHTPLPLDGIYAKHEARQRVASPVGDERQDGAKGAAVEQQLPLL